MSRSKILFLYKLSNLMIFLTAIYLHINIFMPDLKILYSIPLFSLILLFNRKNKILVPILLFILSTTFIFYFNNPTTFVIFIENLSFIFLYIIFLNFIEKNFVSFISIPILIFYLILFEKLIGMNLFLMISSTFLIVVTIFLRFLNNKGFYFWENDFSIKGDPYKKSFKYLLLSLIFFPVFYFVTFINFYDFNKLFIFNNNTTINNTQEIIEETAPESSQTIISRYIFTIKANTQKVVNFLLNSTYLIIFLGFLVFFILAGIILYRKIKNVYGNTKAKKFLLLSFSLSVIFLFSLFFLYKPFEKLIFYLKDKFNIGTYGFTPFAQISNTIRRILPQTALTKISNIYIDIGAILIVVLFIIIVSIAIYFIIFFLYKQVSDKRKIELNKTLENLNLDDVKLNEISGSPKEKIIIIYNNLIKKLSTVIKKFIYETPLEYNLKFKQEKPSLGDEFELITDNFIIAKYSNIDIDNKVYNETFKNYKKIVEKLFKEVYFGGKI